MYHTKNLSRRGVEFSAAIEFLKAFDQGFGGSFEFGMEAVDVRYDLINALP